MVTTVSECERLSFSFWIEINWRYWLYTDRNQKWPSLGYPILFHCHCHDYSYILIMNVLVHRNGIVQLNNEHYKARTLDPFFPLIKYWWYFVDDDDNSVLGMLRSPTILVCILALFNMGRYIVNNNNNNNRKK